MPAYYPSAARARARSVSRMRTRTRLSPARMGTHGVPRSGAPLPSERSGVRAARSFWPPQPIETMRSARRPRGFIALTTSPTRWGAKRRADGTGVDIMPLFWCCAVDFDKPVGQLGAGREVCHLDRRAEPSGVRRIDRQALGRPSDVQGG